MKISLQQAADILSMSDDEVMFLKQTNRINATVDQETLVWEFDLNEVLTLKETLVTEQEEK